MQFFYLQNWPLKKSKNNVTKIYALFTITQELVFLNFSQNFFFTFLLNTYEYVYCSQGVMFDQAKCTHKRHNGMHW